MFGVAVGFKLLAMFLLPVLLYLILARQMKVWHLLLVPVVYVLMMVPAAIAGRPWSDLAIIYVGQFNFFSELAMEAPQSMEDCRCSRTYRLSYRRVDWTRRRFSDSADDPDRALRLQPGAHTILLVGPLSAALMPYLLPKMHDRYFFVADVMTLTLAFVNHRWWVTFPLFQVGSLLAYLAYFRLPMYGPLLAIPPITFGVGILTFAYVRAHIDRTANLGDRTHAALAIGALTSQPEADVSPLGESRQLPSSVADRASARTI